MSDELDKAIEDFNAPKPAPEYVPMKDAYVPEPEKEKEYTNSADGLKKAAKDVEEQRAAAQPEPIERSYKFIGGEDDGKDVPLNQILSLDRAAADLTRQRDFEAAAEQQQTDQFVADTIDATRLDVLGTQQQPAPQVELQSAQPPPQPEAQQAQQQPQSFEEEARRALENPAIRGALENQLQQLEAQRAQYAQAAQEAANLAHVGLLAQFPELQQVSNGNLPAILNVLQANNPQRYAQVVQGLLQTDHLHKAAANARAAQQQIEQARVKTWAAEQDAVMDKYIAQQPPEETRAVKENVARIVRDHYGVDPQQLAQALQTTPAFRAAPFQKMLFESVRNHLTQEAIAAKRVPPSVPNVQRPGASQPASSYSDEVESSALKAFTRNPTPKSAAAYLNAKRAARR